MMPEQSSITEAQWQTVLRRDSAADGLFVFAVRTTGVYCRPSCPSRRPNRANVSFYRLNCDAENDGYRACLRCRPNEMSQAQIDVQRVAEACRLIEDSLLTGLKAPGLVRLSTESGLSAAHFQKLFRRIVGLSPAQYARALRDQSARAGLADGKYGSIGDTLVTAGYNSSSRFYEGAIAKLGMTPATYKAGGAGQTIRYAIGPCWLGAVLVATTPNGVCAVRLGDKGRRGKAELLAELAALFPKAERVEGGGNLQDLLAKVVGKIEQPELSMELPLDVQGTAFEHRVWAALQDIPAGETRSYSDVAETIGRPTASRAVAKACAANPVAVVVPCHRVIRRDGGLSGYRWGLERKAALLEREKELGVPKDGGRKRGKTM